jgi:hypothetical protein
MVYPFISSMSPCGHRRKFPQAALEAGPRESDSDARRQLRTDHGNSANITNGGIRQDTRSEEIQPMIRPWPLPPLRPKRAASASQVFATGVAKARQTMRTQEFVCAGLRTRGQAWLDRASFHKHFENSSNTPKIGYRKCRASRSGADMDGPRAFRHTLE